VTNFASWLY